MKTAVLCIAAIAMMHLVFRTMLLSSTLLSNLIIKKTENALASDGPIKFLQTITIDNASAAFVGEWKLERSSASFQKGHFSCSAISPGVQASATYRPNVVVPGKYDVEIWFPSGTNHSAHSWWIISSADGESRVLVDQSINGGQWIKIAGNQSFAAGTNGFIRLVNNTPGFGTNTENRVVVADAVRLVPANPEKNSIVSENFTPEYIVAASLEKYKSLSSLRTEVSALVEMRYEGNPKPSFIRSECTIQMARPHYLKFTMLDSTNGVKEVLWSNDDGVFETKYNGAGKVDHRQKTQIENAQYALNWKSPKPLVSELFFATPRNWLNDMEDVTFGPETRIDDDDCFTISNPTSTVWIRKSDLLVKQRREESKGSSAPADLAVSPAPAPVRPMPNETLQVPPLRTIPARTLRSPLQPDEQHASSTKTNMPDAEPARSIVFIRTHTFHNIVVNEPLNKEDYASSSMPLLSKKDDPEERRRLALAYVASGKSEQALVEFLWCWDEGKNYKDFGSTRTFTLLREIADLGKSYSPALAALRERRDAIEHKLNKGNETAEELADLARLNAALGEAKRTLSLFDQAEPDSATRKKLIGHVQDQLMEQKRYREVLPLTDPERHVATSLANLQRHQEFSQRYHSSSAASDSYRSHVLNGCMQQFEMVAGAGETDRATNIAETILKADSAPDVLELLTKAAVRSGNKSVQTYLDQKKDNATQASAITSEKLPEQSFAITEKDFAKGDLIEIDSVEKTNERMVVKGRYNLVSEERAFLMLSITTSSPITTKTSPTQRMQISKGSGSFTLVHPQVIPGKPHVGIYSGDQRIANVYFEPK